MSADLDLILVRHGNTFEAGETPVQVGAASDLPLTAKGEEQAQRVADYLVEAQLTPAALHAGPLLRQLRTAEIVAEQLGGVSIELRSELSEIDYGAWEGKTPQELLAVWPEQYSAWTKRSVWPDAFGYRERVLIERLTEWLGLVRKEFVSGQCIVAVSSNGILRYLYSLLFPVEWDALVEQGNVGQVKVGTGHLCHVHLKRGLATLITWNKSSLAESEG